MNAPRSYEFSERLAMSHGVAAELDIRAILLGNIPGALATHPAHQENDRTGTDWWVEHASGRHLSVDCKVRDEDWAAKAKPQDDLALEIWSVVERQKIGWTRDSRKRCDYVLWLWKDTRRWVLVPFAMLCAVFTEHVDMWRQQYRCAQQFTSDGGYHSECVFVPRRVVWAAIYRRFACGTVRA